METANSLEIEPLDNSTLVESDLRSIIDSNLVLRHCKSKDIGIEESTNGFNGDAIALSSIQELFPERFEKYFPVARVMDQLNDEEKYLLLQNYNLSIGIFFKDSCRWDINRNRKSESAFIVAVDTDSKSGYDKEKYYKLGKVGRGFVKKDDIVENFVVNNFLEVKDQESFNTSVEINYKQAKKQFVKIIREGLFK